MPRPILSRLAGPLLTLGFLSLAARIWVAPLFRPPAWRGDYLYGRYHLLDIYLGVPVALLALALLVTQLAPRARRRHVAHRAFALLLGTLVPLFAFDLGYSLLYLGAWKPAYWLDLQHISREENVPDPELGFRRKPNIEWRGAAGDVEAAIEYRTDELGFRNPPDLGDRADVVFVGDSYTEAAQVDLEDTFVRRVGRRLDLVVANLGLGAYGPPQERIVLERHGFSFQPRVVVWQLFEGNDLGDAENWARWREDPDRTVSSLPERYVQNSFFKPLLDLTRRSRYAVPIELVPPEGPPTRMRLRYRFVPDYAERKAEGLEITRRSIAWAAEECRRRGCRLLVVFVPIMLRVEAPWIRFLDPADRTRCFPADSDPAPSWEGRLEEICRDLDVPLLDLFGPLRLRAEHDPRGLYLPTDEHFDLGGHEVAAEAIADEIARLIEAGR